MLAAFVIVSREGLEMFLIVAIILAYLKKTNQVQLLPSVYSGIGASVLVSSGVGYLLLKVANMALWEGVLGVVAVFMVASMVIHMWKVGPQFKQQMETKLGNASTGRPSQAAWLGVFFFTLFMISREGVETALMLFQVKQTGFLIGAMLGLATAIGIAWLWKWFGHLVNLKRFFQVTGVFLLLFIVQIAVYAFHELCEAGIFSQSEAWHIATEPFSPDGKYGKWFSLIMVAGTGLWLAVVAFLERKNKKSETSNLEAKTKKPILKTSVVPKEENKLLV